MDMRSPFLILLGLCITTVAQASKPLIQIVPFNHFSDQPKQVIPSNGSALITYKVTNQSNQVKPLFITLPPGVAIENRGPLQPVLPLCSKLAKEGLGAHQSCLLRLVATAAKIKKNTQGGPWVSIDPDGFSTFQPAQSETLSISVSSLSASVTALALSVKNEYSPFYALTGTARKITLSSASGDVPNVTFEFDKSFPSDAMFTPKVGICGTITPGNPCTITITPGATAASSTLVVYSDTEEQFHIPIDILSYNSVYQGGYVFSVDDTTPDTQSVGGKVAAKENQATFWPFGIIWSSNGTYGCSQTIPPTENAYELCTSYVKIDGIDELSTTPCDGKSDGACNTQVIINYFNQTADNAPIDLSAYAAGLCKATIAEYSDWYLPAICEMGYHVPSSNVESYCGSIDDPLMQNMQSNLKDLGFGGILLGVFWSSTEYSNTDGTLGNSWSQYFFDNVSSYQTHDGKENPSGVRCVRAIT